MEDRREAMRERNSGSKSKLSAWIPKQIHKQAKILATARDIDLQDLVTIALQDYLTDSELDGTSGMSGSRSQTDSPLNGENGNG
jgi:hypothetical protein